MRLRLSAAIGSLVVCLACVIYAAPQKIDPNNTGGSQIRSTTPVTGARSPAPGTAIHGPAANGSARPAAGSVAAGGRIKGIAPAGSHEYVATNGMLLRTRSDGRVGDIHDSRRGMDVHQGLEGGRRVSLVLASGRLVAEQGRRGFVQRVYSFHNHAFALRTYYDHGQVYSRFYQAYEYHGVSLDVYAPSFYYPPAFYGWAYNPWAVPVAYGWGWASAPWYGFYGSYFTPYPVYPGAAFWLTDLILSRDLIAYAAWQETAVAATKQSAAGVPDALTPEVKQQLTDQVREELALENSEAAQNAQQQEIDPQSSGIARLLEDGHPHVFLAGDSLDLIDGSGQECSVSEGDVLQLQTPPAADATTANLVVEASKGGTECPKATIVSVNLADLQEMQNHMREALDMGLRELKTRQGTGGLPAAPASAMDAPVAAQYTPFAPPPDPKEETQLRAAEEDAAQVETEANTAVNQAPSLTPGAPAPAEASVPTISLAMTEDQVRAALGAPRALINLGSRVIYAYTELKVTFTNGKVSDVE